MVWLNDIVSLGRGLGWFHESSELSLCCKTFFERKNSRISVFGQSVKAEVEQQGLAPGVGFAFKDLASPTTNFVVGLGQMVNIVVIFDLRFLTL